MDHQTSDLYRQGMAVRRAVLGDAHVNRATEGQNTFTAPFQTFITEHAWGAAWTRDGLERRERSIITVAVLTALGKVHEIPMHIRAAIGNGLTPEEIREVLIHTGIYAGIPAANEAFAAASDTLVELGLVPPAEPKAGAR